MFRKNQKVVKVITIRGTKSATIETVARVTKTEVSLVDSSLTYRPHDGTEIDPAMAAMGIYSEIIPFDGGEIERLGL